ncbi:response regulator [Rhizobium sp. P44RR-XXIV]|nr:response regulator [Rhizobium sp. P44RR-XXIV]
MKWPRQLFSRIHLPVSKLEHCCPREGRSGLRILLVEDNILLGGALQEHLSSMGWDVIWVTGYRLGADILCRMSFDIICLDRRLPDGDGFDLLRRGLARCPTIIMSAFDQLSDRLEAKRLGAADYLIKPFRLEKLTHRIDLLAGLEPSRVPALNPSRL